MERPGPAARTRGHQHSEGGRRFLAWEPAEPGPRFAHDLRSRRPLPSRL